MITLDCYNNKWNDGLLGCYTHKWYDGLLGCYNHKWSDGCTNCLTDNWWTMNSIIMYLTYVRLLRNVGYTKCLIDNLCTFIYKMSQRELITYETYFDGIGYCKEFGKYMSMDYICQYTGILVWDLWCKHLWDECKFGGLWVVRMLHAVRVFFT